MGKSNIIRDARHFAALRTTATGADLEQWEQVYADTYQLQRRDDPRQIMAYVSGNRWVVTCPDDNAGMAVLPGHPRIMCLICGRVYRVRFPADTQRREGERLLLARGDQHRHWFPQRGETVAVLGLENARHGLPTEREGR